MYASVHEFSLRDQTVSSAHSDESGGKRELVRGRLNSSVRLIFVCVPSGRALGGS